MSRRGGVYRGEDQLPPREFLELMGISRGHFGHSLGGGNMDGQCDGPPYLLPPGRYRYETSEIRNGRRYDVTTTLNIRSTSANPRLRDRFDNDPINDPRGIHRPRIPSDRPRPSSNHRPSNNLRSFESTQTHARVRVPVWMNASEAERVIASAFDRGSIPQQGEIDIVCPDQNSDRVSVRIRSRGGRARTGTTGPLFDDDFPIIPTGAPGISFGDDFPIIPPGVAGPSFDDDFPIIPPDTAPVPASGAAINSLGTKTITEEESGQTCGICMDEKTAGDIVAELKCGHWFDLECVETWLEQNGTCPTCRARVETDVEHEIAEHERGQQDFNGLMRGQSNDTGPGAQEGSDWSRPSNRHFGPSSSATTPRPPTRNPRSSNHYFPPAPNAGTMRPSTRNPNGSTHYSPGHSRDHGHSRSDRGHRLYGHYGEPRYNPTERSRPPASRGSAALLGRLTQR